MFSSALLAVLNPSHAQYGIEHSENGLLINLSEATRNAIDSGVSLTFICDFAVQKKWWFLTFPSEQQRHKFIISRHSLSNRYLVHRDDKPTPATFRSSSQGVAHISKSVQNLFAAYAREKPAIELKVSLSKYDLPAPIRLTAFTSAQWNFDSGWGQWQSIN